MKTRRLQFTVAGMGFVSVGDMLVRRSFTALSDCVERIGYLLLGLYQVVVAAGYGRMPNRAPSPRRLGTAAVLGCVLLVAIMLVGLLNNMLSHGTALESMAAEPSSPPWFIIRCEKCGWQQALTLPELSGRSSRNNTYYCEKCRAHSAHRELLGGTCVATPRPRGVKP